MNFRLSNLPHMVYSYFFHNGEIGVQRYFLCCLIFAVLLSYVFFFGLNYMALASIIASFMIVGSISTIVVFILGAFGLFT